METLGEEVKQERRCCEAKREARLLIELFFPLKTKEPLVVNSYRDITKGVSDIFLDYSTMATGVKYRGVDVFDTSITDLTSIVGDEIVD